MVSSIKTYQTQKFLAVLDLVERQSSWTVMTNRLTFKLNQYLSRGWYSEIDPVHYFSFSLDISPVLNSKGIPFDVERDVPPASLISQVSESCSLRMIE